MPRYFFHVLDGSDLPDSEGTELRDLTAARREGVRFAGALLIDGSEAFWQSAEWRMRVADAAGLTLFELAFLATDAAASKGGDAAAM